MAEWDWFPEVLKLNPIKYTHKYTYTNTKDTHNKIHQQQPNKEGVQTHAINSKSTKTKENIIPFWDASMECLTLLSKSQIVEGNMMH